MRRRSCLVFFLVVTIAVFAGCATNQSTRVKKLLESGKSLSKKNRLDRAAKAFSDALWLNPQMEEGYSGLADVLKKAGRVDQAIGVLRQGIRELPMSAELHCHLGEYFQETGLLKEAKMEYWEALKIEPGRMQTLQKLIEVCDDLGRLEVLEKQYVYLLKAFPRDVYYLYSLGSVYRAEKKYEKALACFQKVRKIKPDFGGIELAMGEILADFERLSEAVPLLEEALRKGTDPPKVNMVLARINEKWKKYDKALEYYEKARSADPENSLYLRLATRALIFQGKPVAAMEKCRQALEKNPKDAQAYICMGKIQRIQKKAKEAEDSFRQALELNPGLTEGYLELAEIMLESGNLEEAQTNIDRAVLLEPDSPRAKRDLGIIYYKKGELAKALQVFEQAKIADPKDALVYEYSGLAFFGQGEKEKARAALEKFLELALPWEDTARAREILTTLK